MKKYKTSSYFVWIIERKNDKFIRRYKRNGLHAYPRTIPLKHIANLLDNTNVLHPKLYKDRIKYIEEKFIENTKEINEDEIQETIISYMIEMYKVDCKNIKKFIKWKNNSEFLKFQIENLKKVLVKRGFNQVHKNIEPLYNLINTLDNNRKLSLIHGDIHTKNMIINDMGIYLIDWELATYGDIAYELATHFILMKYEQKEKEDFINKLCENIPINKESLINDIKIYEEFENTRRKIIERR